MKSNRKSLILFGLLVSVLFLSFTSITVKASTDIDYTFSDNIVFEGENIIPNSTVNLEYFANYTENFPATYSWVGDTNGSIQDWTISEDGDTTVTIENNVDGHNDVVRITDNDVVESGILSQSIEPQIDGTIDFWMRTDDGALVSYFQLQHDATVVCLVAFRGDDIQVQGIGWENEYADIPDNTWYHISLEFDCVTDTFNVVINGILIYVNEVFVNNVADVNQVVFYTVGGQAGFSFWFDAVGYSFPIDTYTGNSFDTNPEVVEGISMTSDGDNLFIVDYTFDYVVEYTTAGVEIDTYDVSNESDFPFGLTFDGTYFWLSDSDSNLVFQYNSEMIYTNFSFDMNPTVSSAYGITEDGEYLYVYCRTKDEVTQWSFDGVYTGITIDVSTESATIIDISFHKNVFWALDDVNDKIYFYDSDWVYMDVSVDLSQVMQPQAITGLNDVIYVFDDPLDEVFEYNDNMAYFIGDNIIPDNEIMGLEVFRDEFAYGYDGFLNEIGYDGSVNGWWTTDPFGNQVQIDDSGEAYDRSYGMFCDSATYRVLSKSYNIDADNINVTIGIEYLDMNNADSDYMFWLTGYGGVILAYFQFIYTGGNILFRWKDSVDAWHTLKTLDPDPELYREINIHYGIGEEIRVIYKTNDSVYETYMVEKYQVIAQGLKQVLLYGQCNDGVGDQYIKFDYVGAYASVNWGESYPIFDKEAIGGYALYFRDLGISNWNTIIDSLVYIEGNAFGIGLAHSTGFTSLRPLYNHSVEKIYNIQDYSNYLSPYIVFITNQTLDIDSLSIKGILLSDGVNDYPLVYSYANVEEDFDQSYFYVVGSRLYFELETNQNNLEYIQASFNIGNVITENYSIRFYSDVFGVSSCNLRLNYTDETSSFYEFPSHATRTSIILPQEKKVGEIIILITDNDELNMGSTTGYIRDVSFVYFKDITTAITTLSLLTVLIPLIVLIVPTVAMKLRFGKSAVVPMFLLMSIVAFATELIPIWIFFLIIISSGAFLIGKRAIGDDF